MANNNVLNLSREDRILKDLIDSNVQQRAVLPSSAIKQAKLIYELGRLNGVPSRGGDKKSKDAMRPLVTQEDIAKQLNMSVTSMKSVKRLLNLIPEIQDLVDDQIPMSVASRIIARLSDEEQRELLTMLPLDEKITAHVAEKYIAILSAKDAEISKQREKIDKQTFELKRLSEMDTTHERMMSEQDKDWSKKVDELQLRERSQYERNEKLKKENAAKDTAIKKLQKQMEIQQKDLDEYYAIQDEIDEIKTRASIVYPEDYEPMKLRIKELEEKCAIIDAQPELSSESFKSYLLQVSNDLIMFSQVRTDSEICGIINTVTEQLQNIGRVKLKLEA